MERSTPAIFTDRRGRCHSRGGDHRAAGVCRADPQVGRGGGTCRIQRATHIHNVVRRTGRDSPDGAEPPRPADRPGSEEVSPTAALRIGSTTVAVAAHSACPVVAWRGCIATPTDRSIVLGVDGMRTGAAAFTAGFELADRFGVGIKAIHAWSAFRTPTGVANTHLIDWDALEAAQWQELLDTLAPWAELSRCRGNLFRRTGALPARRSCTTSRIHNLWSSATEVATC
jgi:hypothetical protein